jgi:parallel beta-helix repeat protein
MIRGNRVLLNGRDGIRVQGRSLVSGNLSVNNGTTGEGFAGIRTVSDYNRVEDNHVKDNDIGLYIAGQNNTFARNTMAGNTRNYGIDPGVTQMFFHVWTVASPDFPQAWDNIDDNSHN